MLREDASLGGREGEVERGIVLEAGVEVLVDFDGAAPRRGGIRLQPPDQVVARPGHRDCPGEGEEAPGFGARFSMRLFNPHRHAVEITVIADWQRPDRVRYYDIGYLRHDQDHDWRMIAAQRLDGCRTAYSLALRPGMTRLGLYPEYNVEDLSAFVARMKRAAVVCRTVGRSNQGRDIWLMSWPSPQKSARPLLVQARDHAYETAGSYAIEGMADWLLSDDPVASYVRGHFDVHILPMTNVDGVFNGLSRLTAQKGADLNRVHTRSDQAHDAIRRTLDEIRPAVYLNIHNWTPHHIDGLLANDRAMADRVLTHLPADHEHHKRWQVETTADFLQRIGAEQTPPEHQSWKNYVKANFGGIGLTLEFPWFALDGRAMRAKGARALAAVALAALELGLP